MMPSTHAATGPRPVPPGTMPTAFGPTAFGPTAFGPTAFGPTAFEPTAFEPTAFEPTAFGPTAFGPAALGPPDLCLQPTEPDCNPIAWLGPVDVENHILVLGGQGPELMCALLRAGATHVTHLRAHERPEAETASLVIVPRVASLDWLATALPSIRRALTAHGRLVLRIGQAATQTQVRRMLTLLGLTAIRCHTTETGPVLSAELPARRFV